MKSGPETRSRLLVMTSGSVISKERYDQTKAGWDRRDTYSTGAYFIPWQQLFGGECRYIIGRIP